MDHVKLKDKIAKLLALANSPNEYEARDALLKARALMAKHKLRPEEISREENCKVVKETIGLICTKMTNTWTVQLVAIIAEHYCCKAYHSRVPYAKKVEVGIVGLEDDFNICKKIILYAYDCILTKCKELEKENIGMATRTEIRKICNAYGWGFCDGLLDMYDRQDQEHQEWSLVMTTPQAVWDTVAAFGKASLYTNGETDRCLDKYSEKGREDGMCFNPATKLEQSEESTAPALEEKKPPVYDGFRQLFVWRNPQMDNAAKNFESRMKNEFHIKVKFAEEVDLYTKGKTRSDVFFYIHEDDVEQFEFLRLLFGILKWSDILKENKEGVYPSEVIKRYSA